MNKLMGQLGKPYRWGGTSPRTGFDCSGLVYAYKDLGSRSTSRVRPTKYHLRDARPVDRGTAERRFVFPHPRTGAADHVGVYVGNGKFIQSPRTGRYSNHLLSEDYCSPLCRRSSRHDAENHSLILVCRCGGRPPLLLDLHPHPQGILLLFARRITTIAGRRHAKVTVKGPAESGLSSYPALRNTLYRRLRLRYIVAIVIFRRLT